MGSSVPARGLVRYRLGHPAFSVASWRAAADPWLFLWSVPRKRRYQTSIRSGSRQSLGLVFRAPPANSARALRRNSASRGQGSSRRRQHRGETHYRTGVALRGLASSQSEGGTELQGG